MTTAVSGPGSDLGLAGRVAVVTGGSRGVGASIVARLRGAGAMVVAADVLPTGTGTPEPSPQTAAEIGDVVARRLDVTRSDEHERLANWVVQQYGRLDIWVNNAGIFPYDEVLEMDDDAWHRVLAVNLDGTFYGARAAGSVMTRQGHGVVVNIGSASGSRVAAPGRAHYATSKAGVESLTRALAREFGSSGVRVLCVAPSAVRTDGAVARSQIPGPGDAPDPLASYAATLPLGRVAEPDEVARVVHFCASDMASFMTGSTVYVDGGQLAV